MWRTYARKEMVQMHVTKQPALGSFRCISFDVVMSETANGQEQLNPYTQPLATDTVSRQFSTTRASLLLNMAFQVQAL